MGKEGENARLIYDLQDQRPELSPTIRSSGPIHSPESRTQYSAGQALSDCYNIQTRSVGKGLLLQLGSTQVTEPVCVGQGQTCEFFQCNVDFAGTFDLLIPDTKALYIIVKVFGVLGLRDSFTIKINHRKILDN